MKCGNPFTGHGGVKYVSDCEVEQGDYNLAHRFGWMPAEPPEPEAVAEVPAEDFANYPQDESAE